MRHSLFLLLPIVLAATRSLAFGISSPSERGLRPTISAETEYQVLLIVTLCLTGLVVSLYVMTQFPDFGATFSEMNQF